MAVREEAGRPLLTGCRLGYLLNFGEALMKDGIVRAVNGLTDP